MTYTVQAEGVCKTFGRHLALDHVDLSVEQGSVQALLGPNGAGKTTLVRILATLLRPDAGSARVAGRDVLADPVGVRHRISLTGQYAAVDDMLTGRENLEMMAELLRVPRRSRATRTAELLDHFGITAADRRVGTYSGGMRRRLDLAVSMISRPSLLFLDEPTTGLDPRSREQVWDTVRGLVREGVTVLLTTQYLEEADQLADTITLIDRGRIVVSGTADDLKRALGSEVLRLHFADPDTLHRAAAVVGATGCDQDRRTLEVATDGSAAHVLSTLGALERAGAPAVKVSTRRPSLDDVFFSLTAEELVP